MKRLGTSGFKFPAKGSLPVILSSLGHAHHAAHEKALGTSFWDHVRKRRELFIHIFELIIWQLIMYVFYVLYDGGGGMQDRCMSRTVDVCKE